jgi:hypothetical protein
MRVTAAPATVADAEAKAPGIAVGAVRIEVVVGALTIVIAAVTAFRHQERCRLGAEGPNQAGRRDGRRILSARWPMRDTKSRNGNQGNDGSGVHAKFSLRDDEYPPTRSLPASAHALISPRCTPGKYVELRREPPCQ